MEELKFWPLEGILSSKCSANFFELRFRFVARHMGLSYCNNHHRLAYNRQPEAGLKGVS